MYLNYLKEDEQQAFLKLTHIVANADNEICKNEKIIIGSFCNEIGIEYTPFKVGSETIEDISKVFSSKQSKKIAILELFSIINANGEYKDSEKEILNALIKIFKLENTFLDDVESWSNSLMSLIEQGTSLVLEN